MGNLFKGFLERRHGYERIDFVFGDFLVSSSGKGCDDVYVFLFGAFLSKLSRDGHTCVSKDILNEELGRVLEDFDGEDVDIQGVFPDYVFELGEIIGKQGDFKPVILFKGNFYLHRYYVYEDNIKKVLLQKLKNSKKYPDISKLKKYIDSIKEDGEEDVDWQKLSIIASSSFKFLAITGGPGTGKTTTVAKILGWFLTENPDINIAIATPTGKAAGRIQESLGNAKKYLRLPENILNLLPTKAVTLHRLLGYIKNSSNFRYNSKNKLPQDIIVIDEASMISLPMMSKLLSAVNEKSILIMLGDKDQLASVELGAVFGDICFKDNVDNLSKDFVELVNNEFNENLEFSKKDGWLENAVIELKKSRRFSEDSGIGSLAKSVNKQDFEGSISSFDNFNDISITKDIDFKKIEKLLKEETKVFFKEYFNLVESSQGLFQEENYIKIFNKIASFQILTGLKKGYEGCDFINEIIEKIIGKDQSIYAGKPVMITKNDYRNKLYNGDVGIILPDKEGKLKFFVPDQENGFRSINPTRISGFETCFAMTIHKSQGSEFDNVLIIMPENHNKILTKELLYTGITRGKKSVKIWCREDVLKKCINSKITRLSGLNS